VVVALSPDGVLVADKESSPKVKDMIGDFESTPMYKKRMWGWSKVLDYAKYENEEMITNRICIEAGKNSTYHYHNSRDEVWTIIKGEGELVLDDNIRRIKASDIVYLPRGRKHALRALSDTELIEVQTGHEIHENDVHRLFETWEDILENYHKSQGQMII